MDSVDSAYDMREYSNSGAFITQWKKGTDPGYKGDNTEEGASGQRGKRGTHHRVLSDRIISDIEKIKSNIAAMREEIMSQIESCKEGLNEVTGASPMDSIEVLNQKFLAIAQSDRVGITSSLNQKYATENNDDIRKILSRGGKIIENNDFNAKTFCNDPAKFICGSKASRRDRYAQRKHERILNKSISQGSKQFRQNNQICFSDGRSCTPGAPGACSDCVEAYACQDYMNFTIRKQCYDTENQYSIDKIFTPSTKRNLKRQTDKAKRDIIRMINSPPQKDRISPALRQKLERVLKEAEMKIPTPQDYKPICMVDTLRGKHSCSKDSDCRGSGAYCGVPQVDYNMYATFRTDSTKSSDSTYNGKYRPCFVPEGMALSSSRGMYGIILHELGHLISSHNLIDEINGLTTSGRADPTKGPFKAERQCFINDELSSGASSADRKANESIADGIQAQVLGMKVKWLFPQTSPAQFNPKAIEYIRDAVADNCSSLSQNQSQIEALRTSRSKSAHPIGEDRINRIIFANKHIQQTLGCNLPSSRLPSSKQKYQTPLNQCMNKP